VAVDAEPARVVARDDVAGPALALAEVNIGAIALAAQRLGIEHAERRGVAADDLDRALDSIGRGDRRRHGDRELGDEPSVVDLGLGPPARRKLRLDRGLRLGLLGPGQQLEPIARLDPGLRRRGLDRGDQDRDHQQAHTVF
jgi:hypothetical protein